MINKYRVTGWDRHEARICSEIVDAYTAADAITQVELIWKRRFDMSGRPIVTLQEVAPWTVFTPGFEGRYCGIKSKVISFDGNRVTIAVDGYEASNIVPADVWRRENE